ncbi:Uncharacterised protein [Mycobacteroides abscessus subsp. abscessus]|nr:Uncharacterised protein [Mycobacteroides abscessus subsp. abscessus]
MHFDRILNSTELEAWDIFLDDKTYRMISLMKKDPALLMIFLRKIVCHLTK